MTACPTQCLLTSDYLLAEYSSRCKFWTGICKPVVRLACHADRDLHHQQWLQRTIVLSVHCQVPRCPAKGWNAIYIDLVCFWDAAFVLACCISALTGEVVLHHKQKDV